MKPPVICQMVASVDGRILKGELAGILALAADSKKPGSVRAAGLAEQIKMVAGIGFEPMTFRL
jgi:site-specific DNA recombinase